MVAQRATTSLPASLESGGLQRELLFSEEPMIFHARGEWPRETQRALYLPLFAGEQERPLVALVAFAGLGATAHPRFHVTQGLSGAAVASRKTVVVGDVRKDSR